MNSENSMVFTNYYKYMIYFSVVFVEAELDYLHIISTVISVCYLSNNEVLCEDLNTGR